MVNVAAEQDDESDLVARLRSASGVEHEVSLRQKLKAQTAGEYEILETLGRGSGGVVFKARRLETGREVAIKCILPLKNAGDALAGAMREAKYLAALSHPGIASI